MTLDGVHPAAAFGFQRAADAYRRGRPDYPDEAIAFLATALRLQPGRRVLDLAAGTGKLTHSLVPTGVLVSTQDVTIRRWAERENNVVHWTELAHGGHFAALEAPNAFVKDVREFFRQISFAVS